LTRYFSNIPDDAWFKSSYSGANTTECVEAAHSCTSTAVRDSKDPELARLEFSLPAWGGFVHAVRTGRLR
jgi:hypothetical protein